MMPTGAIELSPSLRVDQPAELKTVSGSHDASGSHSLRYGFLEFFLSKKEMRISFPDLERVEASDIYSCVLIFAPNRKLT